jgi:hypothetical protein
MIFLAEAGNAAALLRASYDDGLMAVILAM